jgi:hypothetical protein
MTNKRRGYEEMKGIPHLQTEDDDEEDAVGCEQNTGLLDRSAVAQETEATQNLYKFNIYLNQVSIKK